MLKWSSSFKSPSRICQRAICLFSFFFSSSPYAIVIDPYCTKSLLSSNSKDLSRSKSLSVLRVHTLPSHYVSPFTKLIEQCCNGFPQTFVASTPKILL